MSYLPALYIAVAAAYSTVVVADIVCPLKCMCGKVSVDCSFKGFTEVPSGLDRDTESL